MKSECAIIDVPDDVIEILTDLVDRSSDPVAMFVLEDEIRSRSVELSVPAEDVIHALVDDGHLAWTKEGLVCPDGEVELTESSTTDEPEYLPLTDMDGKTVYLETGSLVIEDTGTDGVYRAHADEYDDERSDGTPATGSNLRMYRWFFEDELTDCDYEQYIEET